MKTIHTLTAAGTLSLLALTGCEVEQTEEGRMPDVDVKVEATPGKLPEYDVDTAEVKVGVKEETVKVPDVDLEEEKIKVPTVGIEMPDEDGEKSEELSSRPQGDGADAESASSPAPSPGSDSASTRPADENRQSASTN